MHPSVWQVLERTHPEKTPQKLVQSITLRRPDGVDDYFDDLELYTDRIETLAALATVLPVQGLPEIVMGYTDSDERLLLQQTAAHSIMDGFGNAVSKAQKIIRRTYRDAVQDAQAVQDALRPDVTLLMEADDFSDWGEDTWSENEHD